MKISYFISIVLLLASSIFADVFEAEQSQQQSAPPYENFEIGHRLGTWALNQIVPGVGSIVIMDDLTGAVVQWVLVGGGIFLVANSIGSCLGTDCFNLLIAGAYMFAGSYVYNIYRSITYDKPGPKNADHSKYGDFNVALLPNRHGKVNAHLMYNKAF